MKNYAVVLLLISLSGSVAFAQDESFWGNVSQKMPQSQPQPQSKVDSDTEGPDDFYEEMIMREYGSNASPAFNNIIDSSSDNSNYNFNSN